MSLASETENDSLQSYISFLAFPMMYTLQILLSKALLIGVIGHDLSEPSIGFDISGHALLEYFL